MGWTTSNQLPHSPNGKVDPTIALTQNQATTSMMACICRVIFGSCWYRQGWSQPVLLLLQEHLYPLRLNKEIQAVAQTRRCICKREAWGTLLLPCNGVHWGEQHDVSDRLHLVIDLSSRANQNTTLRQAGQLLPPTWM